MVSDSEADTDLPNDIPWRKRRIDHEGVGRLFQDRELTVQKFLPHEMVYSMDEALVE